jgi:hypothetical protein
LDQCSPLKVSKFGESAEGSKSDESSKNPFGLTYPAPGSIPLPSTENGVFKIAYPKSATAPAPAPAPAASTSEKTTKTKKSESGFMKFWNSILKISKKQSETVDDDEEDEED